MEDSANGWRHAPSFNHPLFLALSSLYLRCGLEVAVRVNNKDWTMEQAMFELTTEVKGAARMLGGRWFSCSFFLGLMLDEVAATECVMKNSPTEENIVAIMNCTGDKTFKKGNARALCGSLKQSRDLPEPLMIPKNLDNALW